MDSALGSSKAGVARGVKAGWQGTTPANAVALLWVRPSRSSEAPWRSGCGGRCRGDFPLGQVVQVAEGFPVVDVAAGAVGHSQQRQHHGEGAGQDATGKRERVETSGQLRAGPTGH